MEQLISIRLDQLHKDLLKLQVLIILRLLVQLARPLLSTLYLQLHSHLTSQFTILMFKMLFSMQILKNKCSCINPLALSILNFLLMYASQVRLYIALSRPLEHGIPNSTLHFLHRDFKLLKLIAQCLFVMQHIMFLFCSYMQMTYQ